jgi:hypothetical protein
MEETAHTSAVYLLDGGDRARGRQAELDGPAAPTPWDAGCRPGSRTASSSRLETAPVDGGVGRILRDVRVADCGSRLSSRRSAQADARCPDRTHLADGGQLRRA